AGCPVSRGFSAEQSVLSESRVFHQPLGFLSPPQGAPLWCVQDRRYSLRYLLCIFRPADDPPKIHSRRDSISHDVHSITQANMRNIDLTFICQAPAYVLFRDFRYRGCVVAASCPNMQRGHTLRRVDPDLNLSPAAVVGRIHRTITKHVLILQIGPDTLAYLGQGVE